MSSRRTGRPPTPAEVDLVRDLLAGPLLSRVLLPAGAALDDHLAEQTVASAPHALGRTNRSC